MKQNNNYTKEQRHGALVYKLTWSEYILADKLNILKKLNEMTGIFVVFYLNKYKRLTPLILGIAWYTGFRPTVLMLHSSISSDPLPDSIREIISNEEIYLKYLEIFELDDLINIYDKLSDSYGSVFQFRNGITIPKTGPHIKVLNNNTKNYRKNIGMPDI